jgi:CheY-like chemotaxis protein/HPt (histidine-containing phosphotransfer) domain-containing protein
MNIAGNAIKFTPAGQILIATQLDRAAGAPPKLVIRITDTGIGIPADKLKLVFDPFTQADSSITRQFGGTGLGLAISHKLAELLGGGIEVESQVGRGTTFTCRIAVGSLENVRWRETFDEASEAGPARRAPPMPVLDGRRVLIVDDGETNRKLIKLVLGRAGARVETAENGQRALDRALHEEFDLILMDMQMPILDGYTATAELRKSGLTIPIIALTANAMKWDEARCLEAGCSGYLSKPVDQELLLITVAAALETLSAAKLSAAPPPPATRSAPPPRGEALVSELPTDDPDFRAVVEEFVTRLHERLSAMRRGLAAGDLASLAQLAHWLKGTGGTAGFPAFTEPAGQLERVSRQGDSVQAAELIGQLERIAARIVIPGSADR